SRRKRMCFAQRVRICSVITLACLKLLPIASYARKEPRRQQRSAAPASNQKYLVSRTEVVIDTEIDLVCVVGDRRTVNKIIEKPRLIRSWIQSQQLDAIGV